MSHIILKSTSSFQWISHQVLLKDVQDPGFKISFHPDQFTFSFSSLNTHNNKFSSQQTIYSSDSSHVVIPDPGVTMHALRDAHHGET